MKNIITKLGKTSIIYGIGNMLTRFINFLLLPLFTAYLTPTDYGILALITLLTMIAQPIFSLGLGAAMGPSYFEGNDSNRKSQTIWTAFFILLISSFFLTVTAWTFSEQLSRFVLQTSEYNYLVSITLTGCAISILTTPFTQKIQFEEQAKLFVIITTTSSLITISLSLYTVISLSLGVKGVVISQLIGQSISFLLFFVAGTRKIRFIYNIAIGQELLQLGIPLVPSFAFLFFLMHSNRYTLQWFEGLEQVGIYSIGFNIGMVMTIAVNGFQQAWYPFFIQYINKMDEAYETFGLIFRHYFVFFGFITVCFFLFSGPVVSLLTKPEFHEAYKIVGFSALAQFLIGLFSLLTPGMYFSKEVKYICLWQGIATVLSVPLNIIFIWQWGLMGAGISLAISTFMLPIGQLAWNIWREKTYIKINYCFNKIKFMPILILLSILDSMIYKSIDLRLATSFTVLIIVALLVFTYKYVIQADIKSYTIF